MTAADPLDPAAGDDRPQPILLGEAPSRAGDQFHAFPLSGRPAKVLCELAGIPPQPEGTRYGRWTWALYEHFDCRNLIERYADATPWPTVAARGLAVELLDDLKAEHVTVKPAPVIVCLGRKVQTAVFGALDSDLGRAPLSMPGAWGGEMFGNFGVWAHPWNLRVPIVRPCEACGGTGTWKRERAEWQGVCEGGWCEACERTGKIREQRWAPHVVTIPHPSGLNRLRGDEAARGRVLRRALDLAGGTATVPA
jgi:hypothetical protein